MTVMQKNRECISFVILTWNSRAYIEACLAAILKDIETSGFGAEIFIVDNGSKDGSRQLVSGMARAHPGLIFPIWLDSNYGTTVSRNLALKKANGRFICILDSDIQILPGLLTRLIRTLTRDRAAGLVAPKLVYPDGRLQKSTDQFPTLTRKLYRYFFLKKLEGRECRTLDSPTPVDYAISALWVFERSLIERIGGLDERIFYAPEDAEFCHRIWKAGLQVIYDPRASAVHHTQEISRGGRLNRAFVHHILGLTYYYVKHKFIFKRPRFRTPLGSSTGKKIRSRAALKKPEERSYQRLLTHYEVEKGLASELRNADRNQRKKIRICHVVFAFKGIGGLENGLINIINNSDPRRFHHVVCALTQCGEIRNRVTGGSVSYISLNKREGNDPRLPFALARVFRRHRIDLVHLRNWPTMVEGVIGARMAGVRRVIYSEHGRHFEDVASNHRLKFRIKQYIFKSVSVLLTVSEEVAKEMTSLYRIGRDVRVIRNGVDTARFRTLHRGEDVTPLFPGADDEPVIGTVCRLVKGKGLSRFIRAFSEDPHWARVVIVGDGPERSALDTLVKTGNLGNRVRLLGARDDIPELLNGMDLFFLPSESEGLSNVVMEAMACGLPVVAFDTGGNRELVDHERGGYLVAPERMDRFLSRVKELARNRGLAKLMGQHNESRVKGEFTLHHMVSAYTRMYEGLMDSPERCG